ncbi:MAG TPA: tRNA (guanosine(46)-N7)-methyltransferase TrmB [Gammaproteobacteria bacterium]
MSGEVHLRRVRSFVRRPGRITAAQRRALDTLAPRYRLPRGGRLDLDAVFGRRAPRVLDVGFGDGEALVTAAVNFPHLDYLGIEVHEPGIGHLLLLLEQAGLANVRVIEGDAADVLPEMLADAGIAAVNLFFPDPWPKKRHHKRRLVQPPFVAEVARVLEDGGLLHVASDWAGYVEHTRGVLAASEQFVEETAPDLCHNPLAFRAPTKFERRGRRLGHEIVDLYYRRVPRRPPDTP